MIILQTNIEPMDYELWNLILRAIQAAATICVALLAIFGSRILAYFFKPKLSLTIESKNPFQQVLESRVGQSSTKKHMSVSARINNKGNSTANNCQVFIDKVYSKRTGNDTYFKFKEMIPSRFEWDDQSISGIVTPKIPSYIEIVRVEETTLYMEDSENQGSGQQSECYDLYVSVANPESPGRFLKLGKGTYILPVILYSDNQRTPIETWIQIYWNGTNLDSLSDSVFYVKTLSYSELPKIMRQ